VGFPVGGRVIGVQGDVTNYEQLVTRLGDRHYFAIMNSAGSSSFGVLEKASTEDIEAVLMTNVVGTLNVARFSLNHLDEDGHLIIVSSAAASIPLPVNAPYAMAKAAQDKLAEQMVAQLPGSTSVTIVKPGVFQSDVFRNRFKNPLMQLAFDLGLDVSTFIRLVPSAAAAAREMIADVERGRSVSTPGRLGTVGEVLQDPINRAKRMGASLMARVGFGVPLGLLPASSPKDRPSA